MTGRLPAANPIVLTLDDERPRRLQRSSRRPDRLPPWSSGARISPGAVVAIGNAPTALFHLLDRLSGWPERPAAILAFPVGFVGAVKASKP